MSTLFRVGNRRRPIYTYLQMYYFHHVLFFSILFVNKSYICDNYIPIKHVIYRRWTIITKQTPYIVYIVIICYDYILNIITCNIFCGMSWSNILFILIDFFFNFR